MPNSKHQLAAIMFTDIVGYTALMGEDEQKTFELLKKNRRIQFPIIKKYGGKLIKEIGDGFLASFNSVSDAVYCSGEIQKRCDELPELNLRIGIHQGEVVFEGKDVYGDGVNIASRIEALAPSGGIVVSESVYQNLINKKGISATFIREQTLKNVTIPVKIYLVEVENVEDSEINSKFSSKSSSPTWQKPATWQKLSIITLTVLVVLALGYLFYINFFHQQSDKEITDYQSIDKSIAVLPLEYLSDDSNKQYLANGVVDAITGHLSKIEGLRVTPKTSVEQYRGTAKTASVIGEELNVSYLIEGSFLMVEDQVILIIQLVNAKEEDHVFYEEYKRDYKDIITVQSEVAQTIAKEIEVVISPEVEKRIEAIPTENLEAYDFYLKGMDYLSSSLQEEEFRYAVQMFEQAVEIDSNFTLAWIGLANASRNIYWYNYDRSEKHLSQTKQYLDKAIILDPDLMEVQLETGWYYYHCKMNYPKALQILENLKSNYPNNDQLYATIGFVYRRMGEYEVFFEYIERAISLNPSNWIYWFPAGETSIILRRYVEAQNYLKTAIKLNPSADVNYSVLATSYILSGQVKKARSLLESNPHIDHPKIHMIRSYIELIDRNYNDAIEILESSPHDVNNGHMVYTTKSLEMGLIYYAMSNRELANTYFNNARQELEKISLPLQEDSRLYSSLGIAYAGLGMRAEAIEAGNTALSIMNMSVDSWRGFARELDMTRILMMVGNYDEAIVKLEFLLQQNGYISVELLKRDPFWDPLRDIDAFNTLIENPKYQIQLGNN